MQLRGDSVVLCVLHHSPDCRIYIADTKTTCCPWLQSPQKLKMISVPSTEPHWPLQAASQLNPPVWPSGWQLLWTTVSLQVRPAPKACVKLIQYHRRYASSTPLLQQPESRDMVPLWSVITLFTQQMDTEIGTRLWTCVRHSFSRRAMLYGRWEEMVRTC